MSQGIINLTSQEATKRDASIKESLLRSKKILCPILANRQDFTNKRKTFLSPTRLTDGCCVTDGQLDLRPEEGGERPEESASHGHVIKKTREN